MSIEMGIYTGPTEKSFVPDCQVKRKLAIEGSMPSGIVYQTPFKVDRSTTERLVCISERAKKQKEIAAQADNFVELTLPPETIINLWGDLHMFNENTDHDRIARELEVIANTPNSFVVLGADLVDGIFWGGEGGGEQVGSLTEQVATMRSLFSTLNGKVLLGVSGEHDSKWMAKSGADPYSELSYLANAPYVKGVAEVLIHCGEVDYRMVVQHKAKGHSMYNKNHPTFREARFSLQGADVYVNFHTHQKQIAQESIRRFGGSEIVTHVSSGTYKPKDSWTAREGFVTQSPQEMYGAAIYLHGDRKKVEVEFDIIDAHRKWGGEVSGEMPKH